MWTPKRIVLLALGFALLFALYLVYAHYLGGIDGLPPLPAAMLPPPDGGPVEPPMKPENDVDGRLTQAFGVNCRELSRAYRFEVHSRGVVLATDEFIIEEDGRVRLRPVSLALFSKKTEPGKFPEINTIRAGLAYLTFDRPIRTIADMGKCKITGAELRDNIEIANNRRTPQRDDDVFVIVRAGPLYYQERPRAAPGQTRQPDIWTDKEVEIRDEQGRPEPTKITAEGMELYLTTEEPNPKAPQNRKPRNETINGLDKIVLRSNVTMYLYVDAGSGFLGSEKEAAAKPPAPGADKRKLVIDTAGSFVYDVPKDFARFDIPDKPSQLAPYQVHVNRYHELDKHDQLICDHLELQFRRKKSGEARPASGDDRSLNLEVETAHATGEHIAITSDAEVLAVPTANEFLYDARTRMSTIKGSPEIVVLKDGHELHARQLDLVDQKGAQHTTAYGPGTIDLLDKASGKRPVHARWKDKLISTKDGAQDLLHLTGDAAFTDEEHGQHLQADCLKVWIEPGEGAAGAPAPQPAAAPGQGGRRPRHVEALGHVVARSKEMHVHDAEKLVLWFKDVPAPELLPTAVPVPPVAAGHVADKPPAAGPAAPPLAKPAAEPEKPARPIDLSARIVEAHVLRFNNGKNELEKLWTQGDVHVVQEPADPQDKGVDIRGDTLQLHRQAQGNLLVVSHTDIAQLRLDKIVIFGPEITIDQAANEAWVHGGGAMQLESNTNFQGTKLAKPVPLTIHWDKTMLFKGQSAVFEGGVQAEQENSRLSCQTMHVEFDRPVSLRDGEKRDSNAKVDRLVCDKSVMVEDCELQGEKLQKRQRFEGRELNVDNTEGIARGSGPGVVRIVQAGAGPDIGPPPAPGKPAPPKRPDEMKLTRVTFGARMWANNKTHTAIFYENVEVVSVPGDNIDADPNLDQLPEGGLYLRCDQLKVLSTPGEGGKATQQMEATGRVMCRSREFWGWAETVTYHEGKDQVIFDGKEGFAHVERDMGPGHPRQQLKGRKIIYLRKTGEFKVEGAGGVSGSPVN